MIYTLALLDRENPFEQVVGWKNDMILFDPDACTLPPTEDLVGWQVLDIACESGAISRVLTSLGASVTGLDCSETMLGLARQKLAGADWRPVLSDAEAMIQLEDASFDLAATRHLAWTLAHPQDAYAEWLRGLKPGGRLLVVDGNFRAPKSSYQRLRNLLANWLSGRQPSQGDRDRHEAILDRLPYRDGLNVERLAIDLEGAGFEVAGLLPVRRPGRLKTRVSVRKSPIAPPV